MGFRCITAIPSTASSWPKREASGFVSSRTIP